MKKSLKETFLTIPLNYQISLAILFIFLIYSLIITCAIFTSITMLKNIFIANNKYYFLSTYLELFESTISFYNLCLLQYEEIVKFFGEQSYLYLATVQLLHENIISFNYENIVINYNTVTNYTCDIDTKTPENKIYLYCSNENVYSRMSNLIEKNSISSLNIISAITNFRISYYRNFPILNNYLFNIPSKQCSFSLNITKLKEYLDTSNNNLYNYLQKKSNAFYYEYRTLFEIYKRTKFSLFDLIFSSKSFIFEGYINLVSNGENEDVIEEYIKKQSRYFQIINYGTEETYINDNINLKLSSCMNFNTIINNFIDYFFIDLMPKQDDIINVPLYLKNNTIYSKNLCYFLLLKQIRILNHTINTNSIFSEEKLTKIYNNLQKGYSTIEDCILDKYYSHKNLNKIGFLFQTKFYSYFQLENSKRKFLFKLVENDENSYFYLIQHSYPSYTSLKDFDPRYFPLSQLNIYSFTSAYPPIKAIDNSKHSINCFEKIAFLYLMFEWFVLLFIIICILNKIQYIIIKPIINLRDVLNKKEITDETKFEYKYDDQINEFFKSCKLLLNSNKEKKGNELKNMDKSYLINNPNNNYDNSSMHNNNMILNLKMINELVDSEKKQKSNGEIIEWNWKKIYNKHKNIKNNNINNFIKNENYLIKKRNTRKLTHNQNLILLQKESSKVLEFDNEKDEIKDNENEEENSEDLILYEYLLLITEYLYNNWQYHERFNKYKNSKNNDVINKIKDFLTKKNNKSKYITYIWYSKMKEKNKNDFIKSYFNKSFEDIFIDEENNANNNNITTDNITNNSSIK